MPRVLCAGHVNWDVTLRVDALPGPDGEAAITEQCSGTGGSAANVARVLAGLDVAAHLCGSVGGDTHGALAERSLRDAGVDLSGLVTVDDRETSVKYLLVEETGEVLTLANDGANEALRPADVDESVVRAADHVHLTSQRPTTAEHLARVARDAGVPVSFDPGPRLAERDFGRAASLSTLVFLNEREAERARDTSFLDGGTTVVETHGADGATLEAGDRRVSHPGFAVEPADTTGAGDAFAAGFVAARLAGHGDADALAVGNACGALTARVTGSRPGITWRDVDELVAVDAA